MPIHDWTRVKAGIFHHFHLEWISATCRALNDGLLPKRFYALGEQIVGGPMPDVLTLQEMGEAADETAPSVGIDDGPATATLVRPKASYTVRADAELYRRRQRSVVVRHVSNDRMVAVIEIISPGNKSGKIAFQELLDKTGKLLDRGIHLLLVDLFPPTRRDPNGLHEAIWEYLTSDDDPSGAEFQRPPGKPLTVVAYESDAGVQAHIEAVAVGEALPDMPLLLEPGGAVMVPLEATYQAAYAAVPQRWRRVLEPAGV
jgi:Protein of unknown function (DUF4058)